MRVLIFTSSGGTAHDAAAGALGDWLRQWDPGGDVGIEQVLENGSGRKLVPSRWRGSGRPARSASVG